MEEKMFDTSKTIGRASLCIGFAIGLTLTGVAPSAVAAGRVVTRCTTPNTMALTFDDGPSAYTRELVKLLDKNGAKATFFVNGDNHANIQDKEARSSVRATFNSGHQIANHSWSHKHLTTLSRSQIQQEIRRLDDELYKIIGKRPAFIRPPYGEYNDLVVQVARSEGADVAIWDFDSRDSMGATPEKSKELVSQFINGRPSTGLLLFHDVSETTVRQIAPFTIQKAKAAGYRLVTLAECLGQSPYRG